MHHDKHESKKSSGGHKSFGKSGGGSEGMSSKLLHSPMSKKMTPKGGGKQLSGKTKGY